MRRGPLPESWGEKHIREALTAACKRRGVDLAEFDASIRSIMVAAAFSTGVEEQVEAFIRLARVAEQFDLPDDLRRELAVKAYRSYGESLPSAESTIVRSDAGSEHRFRPSGRAPLRPESRNVLRRRG
jgi:transcriptional regulator NrdR family protein